MRQGRELFRPDRRQRYGYPLCTALESALAKQAPTLPIQFGITSKEKKWSGEQKARSVCKLGGIAKGLWLRATMSIAFKALVLRQVLGGRGALCTSSRTTVLRLERSSPNSASNDFRSWRSANATASLLVCRSLPAICSLRLLQYAGSSIANLLLLLCPLLSTTDVGAPLSARLKP